jgi:hypothetical protein
VIFLQYFFLRASSDCIPPVLILASPPLVSLLVSDLLSVPFIRYVVNHGAFWEAEDVLEGRLDVLHSLFFVQWIFGQVFFWKVLAIRMLLLECCLWNRSYFWK